MGSAGAADTQRGRRAALRRPPPTVHLVAPPLEEGTELADGRYRIDGVRGRGRQGVTYTATDRRRDRPVVVTELLPVGTTRRGDQVEVVGAGDGPGPDTGWFAAERRRFVAESRTLARVVHPNVVTILAVLEERGTAYTVTASAPGRLLTAALAERGTFAEGEALDIAQQAADALAAVRLVGLASPGVTAADLVLTSSGRVVLVDPGLATADRAEGPPSPRADVHALGALLHHLLAGTPVPSVDADADTDVDGPGATPVPLWRVNPTVSRPTSEVITAALAADPGLRPASPAVLLQRLGGEVGVLGVPELVDLRPDPLAPAPAPTVAPRGVPAPAWTLGELGPWRPPLVPAAATVALVAPVVSPSGRTWPVPVPVGPTTTARLPRLGVRPVPGRLTAEERQALARVVPVGRRWLTVPLAVAGVALASVRPVAGVGLLGLAAAPLLATLGDRALRPERAAAWLPVWWARNVAIGLVRLLGPALVLFLGTCLWFGSAAFEALAPAGPWLVRGTGVVAGALVVASIGRGGEGFRSHVGLDHLTRRLVPGGRLSRAGALVLLVCLGLAALGLAVDPEAWPFH